MQVEERGGETQEAGSDPALKTEPAKEVGARSRVWSWLQVPLKLAILGLAIFLVTRLGASVGWADVGDKLSTAAWPPLIVAFGCLVMRFVVWQQRWSFALASIGEQRPPTRRLAALTASILVNHITPTARVLGGIVRARYLAREEDYGFARVYGAVLFDQLVHHSVTGVFNWLAFIGLSLHFGKKWVALAALVLVPAVAGLAAWRARKGDRSPQRRLARGLTRRLGQRSQRIDVFLDRGREVGRVVARLLKEPAVLWRSAGLSVVYFLLNVTAQTLLFAAVGADVSFQTVAIVVALGAFAGALAGTPGGVGSTEAAMIAGYAALGVAQLDAVSGTLLYRALHYVAVAACGLPSLAWLELRRGRSRTAPPPA